MSVRAIPAIDHRDTAGAIRRLAVPSAFMIVSDQLLGIVDTIFVGSLGTDALASITTASAVFIVFGVGFYAFTSGLRTIGAQAIGAGKSERFGTIVRSSAIVPFALAAFLATAFTFGAEPLMAAMLPRGVAPGAASHYLILRAWSLLPIVFTQQLCAAFATAGDTRLGLKVLLVINVVHIPLLGVLALGFATHHPFGLAGAGTSSLVAEIVGCAFAAFATLRRPELRVFESWRVERGLIRSTASLSWPEFVFLTLQIAPEPITVALIAPSGAAVVAAFRALALVNDVTWSVPGSIGDACETIVAQRIGARDYAGANAFRRESLRIGVGTCALVGLIIAALAWPLSALFTLNASLADVAALPLAAHVALTMPLKGLGMTTIAPIRASGDVRWVMSMGIVTTAVAIAGLAGGILVLHLGLWSVPFGWVSMWIVRDALTLLRVRSGDWERRRLA